MNDKLKGLFFEAPCYVRFGLEKTMNSTQMGRFKIDEDIIRDNPDEIATVFAMLKLVPVRCECLFAQRVVEYVAISERFPQCDPKHMVVPLFELQITKDLAGGIELVEVVAVT